VYVAALDRQNLFVPHTGQKPRWHAKLNISCSISKDEVALTYKNHCILQ